MIEKILVEEGPESELLPDLYDKQDELGKKQNNHLHVSHFIYGV